jgi:hypothetical protein
MRRPGTRLSAAGLQCTRGGGGGCAALEIPIIVMPDRAIYLLAAPGAQDFASSEPDRASPTAVEPPVDAPRQGSGAEAPIPVAAVDGRVGIPDELPGSMEPVARHAASDDTDLDFVSRVGRDTRPRRFEAEAAVGATRQRASVTASSPKNFVLAVLIAQLPIRLLNPELRTYRGPGRSQASDMRRNEGAGGRGGPTLCVDHILVRVADSTASATTSSRCSTAGSPPGPHVAGKRKERRDLCGRWRGA